MFSRHQSAHFHAAYNEYERVRVYGLPDLEMLAGKLPPGGKAENPSGNQKDSKPQRKMFGIGVVVQHLVPLPAGRQVGDLSRSDAFGSGYTFRLRF